MQNHPGRHEVTKGENVVELTPSEFRNLHYLARRPGGVYSREQNIDAIRGHGYEVTDRAIDVQVVGLRKKLGEYGKFIETGRGIGYRIRDRRRPRPRKYSFLQVIWPAIVAGGILTILVGIWTFNILIPSEGESIQPESLKITWFWLVGGLLITAATKYFGHTR
jgi:Response regulators consisting of a CheY-like receiver domain and a winged-helix DNA-binding domain